VLSIQDYNKELLHHASLIVHYSQLLLNLHYFSTFIVFCK